MYAIKCNLIDRKYVLKSLGEYNLWNLGLKGFLLPDGTLKPTESWLCCLNQSPGIYVIEGILNPVSHSDRYQIIVANQQLENKKGYKLIFLDTHIEMGEDLAPILPIKEIPLPRGESLKKLLEKYQKNTNSWYTACLGLSKGEVLELLPKAKNPQEILSYKAQKLQSKGLSLPSEPDVPDVAGLDLLKKDLQTIADLFSPTALAVGLRPPKGVMALGLPGTGKSLTCKLAAKYTGALLISLDWTQLYGSTVAETLDNLDYVLKFVDLFGNVILTIDEFEKAIAGALTEGGVTTKLTGKLLNWLQDHTTPVLLFVTINHLQLLPPEMFRRFEYVWFFDNELHNGAMYEIFNLHLSQRFSCWQSNIFTDYEWFDLFTQYRGYTAAEIGTAIKRLHTILYEKLLSASVNLVEELNNYPVRYPQKFHRQLIEVQQEVKASISIPLLAKQLEIIRMNRHFTRPVLGEDTSRFSSYRPQENHSYV
ncbi:AAA family ATPase [Crocosphaera chwakensis]|uniref:Uncharacterized AAA domain-containing protein ycf46 n=1 Tax=Crocosphaera chwakensis CCY0110 TaxID=391612 RepID=A3IZE2_9CHRO|nr:ATP-binding protein [Crocosphaera chwakensis]EAZ88154.1 ATPase [Crocosphaera chwakensis CCY0110]